MSLTAYIRPSAAGDETNIATVLPSESHYLAVAESSPDEDTSYISESGAVYARDLYNLDDPGLSATINWVKVWMRCKCLAAGWAKTAIKTGGTAYNGSEENLGLTYANYSTQYITNPKTGVAWTWADLGELQAGVALLSMAEKGVASYCTQVFVEINYDEAVPFGCVV